MQASFDAVSAAFHEFRIPSKALLGLHSYCPVHFDAFHAVLVDLSIHVVFLKAGTYTRAQKVSRFVMVSVFKVDCLPARTYFVCLLFSFLVELERISTSLMVGNHADEHHEELNQVCTHMRFLFFYVLHDDLYMLLTCSITSLSYIIHV